MKLHKIRGRSKRHLTAEIAENAEKKIQNNLCALSDLVYLCQELFLMLFREAGKYIFKIALVTENVTLSNPGI
jgi:hypothetical protein